LSPFKPITLHRWTVVGCAVALLTAPPAAWLVSGRVDDNCQSVHTLYVALDRIMVDNDHRIARAVKEHLLTADQAAESRRFNQRARKTLRDADCD
jgi:hypothetical protein